MNPPSKLLEKIRNAALFILGPYLFLVLSFDKGFAYKWVKIDNFPIFITETVLAGTLIGTLLIVLVGRGAVKVFPRIVWFFFILLWVMGFVALFRIPTIDLTTLIPALK